VSITIDQPYFRTDAVADMTGATYRNLDYWVRKGLLKPHHPMPGSGTVRYWRLIDVRVARALVAFSALGVTNSRMYEAISDAVYSAGDGRDAAWLVAYADGRAELLRENQASITEPCWIYPLESEQS
jgi:DNA-binding transcriptional MerR regulator